MPLSPTPEVTEFGTFEAAYEELQRIVAQLEDGQLDLENAVRLFERGSHLVQVCERMVNQAELRVTRLAAEPASPISDVPLDR
jgi:exodeoxyribonuclease VII small subunit